MTALASRAYAHRSRNGFLIALWIAKNNPDAFNSANPFARKIVLVMLDVQAGQKLGRRPKLSGTVTISSEQKRLLSRVREANADNDEDLLKDVCEYGLSLVTLGWISIQPDDDLREWELTLSPEGEIAESPPV